VKAGYPPQVLTVIPELPLASLGIKSGEQLIVSELPGLSPSIPVTPSGRSNDNPPVRRPVHTSSTSVPVASAQLGPDYVDTDGGVLVHRVSLTQSSIAIPTYIT